MGHLHGKVGVVKRAEVGKEVGLQDGQDIVALEEAHDAGLRAVGGGGGGGGVHGVDHAGVQAAVPPARRAAHVTDRPGCATK